MEHHTSYLQKHASITRSRINNFINDGQWRDVNLKSVIEYLRVSGEPHVSLEVWSAPGQDRPAFEHAVKQKYRPAHIGETFGPSWTTHWFRVMVNIPREFVGRRVRFEIDTGSEAMIWSADGEPIMGLTGGGGRERHVDYLLTERASEHEEPRQLYVEMACNDLFGNGDYHQRPQDRSIYYRLNSADLVSHNEPVLALYYDLQVINDMANRITEESPRSWQALAAANAIVNVFEHTDLSTVEPAREIARQFFKAQGGDSNHQVYAIGNCHIDTAWLWPYAETKRKAARSWSTQLQLMDVYPEYKFAASQGQQLEWLKENYPSLFSKIQDKAKTGQFIPIGATWVECDCNMPSGESLVRQFLLGQHFFKEHFGEISDVFWLPDTFGYASQLPQIVRLAGAKYFFTQKLSWNSMNRFPNTTFRWVGLDGSHVLTHMAPSNTYVGQCTPGELMDSVKRHKDLSYTNESLYLFGNGDGGGGPLRDMLERMRRMENLDGLPRVKQAHPREFYEHVEQTTKDLVSWKGELYFELHRGTYTSQANNKLWNRQSEFVLRDVELLSTIAHSKDWQNFTYPADELTRLWKLVCLNQFHDVIPGSSINMVYRDSDKIYEDVFASAKNLRRCALDIIYGELPPLANATPEDTGFVVLNTTSWMRTSIVAVPAQLESMYMRQTDVDSSLVQVCKGNGVVLTIAANVPGYGAQVVTPSAHHNTRAQFVPVRVSASETHGSYVMENRHVRVVIDSNGRITSYYDHAEKRELVAAGAAGNVLELYDDVPDYWDAWDIEVYSLEKYRALEGGDVTISEEGPLVASLQLRMRLSESSTLTQKISLSAISTRLDFETNVDWHENRKCLKASFTWDIVSDVATYETQFGVVQRPTHRNTSWDIAKFEVCAHKFTDLSEFGYGVALLNDCKYGHATLENKMSLSLLRAPKAPDEHCDMGQHRFRYAVYPHVGSFNESNVVQEAYQFNVPLQVLPVNPSALLEGHELPLGQPCFSISGARNVVLDTVKLAEDKSGYIVRLYEAYGGHARALLTTKLPAASVHKVNILEKRMCEDANNSELCWLSHSKTVEVVFKPFEIVTLKFISN
ncbi:Glycoside hydrolase, 38 vacuolar alpha mannosidase [Coemansia furcata]|uniref:Glycoside hydrolase, 38 vacuolar alpha mannosidase n=1 Tax=Coemansia furcata TaxID=417177 RepID=A0ACC1LLK6_9FUNG|nr:Glycoside hydrolase, 38 vacuolar alpha mannosidase [Coemansia furcata]